MLSLRLAWRNLWRHRRRTWLTVSAMIFCNALLVAMNSMQFGSYRMMIDGTLSLLTGHVQVQHKHYNDEPRMRYVVPHGAALATQLRGVLPDSAVAARAVAFGLASSEQRSFGVQFFGVEPAQEPGVSTLPGLVKAGRYLQDSNAAEAVLGSVLARNLKVTVGDELTLLGSGLDSSFAAGVVSVVGILESGMTDLDRNLAQLPLGYFQATFAMNDAVHQVVIKVPELSAVAPVKSQVEALIHNPDLTVLDWDQLQPGLRQSIQVDLASSLLIYSILVVLVAFSVLNTQLMSVLERTREFGVMMALGLRPGRLGQLVLLETGIMSFLGFLFGAALGIVITLYFQHTGIYIPGMEEAMSRYNLPGRLYPELSILSALAGPAAVFVGGMLAAIYPALRLFRLQPVAAMRAV